MQRVDMCVRIIWTKHGHKLTPKRGILVSNEENSGFHHAKSLVGTMRQNAERVNKASEGRVIFIEEVVNRSKAITASVEEIQSNSKGNHNTLNLASGEVSKIVGSINDVVNSMQKGLENAKQMAEKLEQFENQFQRVGKISSEIAAIAKQTNMLALNAKIEAQRAGQYGKGFSVVAEEVKELANSTGQSASEIDQMVSALTTGIETIVADCGDLEGNMDVSASVGQQSLTQIDHVGGVIRDAVTSTADTAGQAAGQISEFDRLVEQLGQLRDETKAAVTGSANNMKLASDVLVALEQM